jgi:O-antigen/teichoic acid export membrane protein
VRVRRAELSSPNPLRLAVAGSVAGKSAEMVTLVLLATVVPRVLGPVDYGRFAVPLTVVTLVSLAMTLGGPTLMARFVPAAPVDERLALARTLGWRLARSRALQLVGVGLGATIVALVSDRWPATDIVLVLVALVANVAATLVLQVGLGLGRTGPWSARYPVQNGALIVSVLLLHSVGDGVGSIVALVIAGVVGLAFAVAATWTPLTTRTPVVPIPSGALRFGALQSGAAALVQFAQRGGVLAVALIAGSDSETGYAALAVGIALGATYAVLQTFTVSLPHLASGDDTASGEAVLRRLALGLVAALVVGLVAVAAFLDELVPLVFGDEFVGAVTAFVPALAVVALAPLHSTTVQSAALRYRPEAALASGVAAALTFVLVALVAVPIWDAAGGTAATLAGVVAGSAVAVWRLPRAAGRTLVVGSYVGATAVLAVGMWA